MPRKDLTLSEKISLLEKIKSQPAGTSQRQLAEITGAPKSTISRLLQNADKIREEWASKGNLVTSQKRKRVGKDPAIEEALYQWFLTVTAQGVRVSGPMLHSKSEELAQSLHHHEFKANDGWLSRWKHRHNIKLKKVHGEKGSADIESAKDWKLHVMPEFLQKYSADDIYYAHETGLYYRATPDGSLTYKHAKLLFSKKALDRMTVFCCVNMSGNDKRKLLVVGKSEKPRCFKGLRLESLPVEYFSNKNAWMTSTIFTEWLKNWDAELSKESRTIQLVIDNIPVHPDLKCLQNIQLKFLPSNTTYLVQPLNMGVIKNLKSFYRGKLVSYILEGIEMNVLTPQSSAKEISAKINILQAIQFLSDSWRQISSSTIKNCFAHCGFKVPDFEVPDEPIIENQLAQVRNNEEFSCIDENINCWNDEEECEVLIEQIKSSRNEEQPREEDDDEDDDDDDDDDDDEPELERITLQEAKRFVTGLRKFFMQEGNEDSPVQALDICADFVNQQSSS